MMFDSDFSKPIVAVDLVILTVLDTTLHVFLLQRSQAPFQGLPCLPGGFVRTGKEGESVEEAAWRVLKQKTELPLDALYLEQLYTFGSLERDPRDRVISVSHLALIRQDQARYIAQDPLHKGQWYDVASILRAPPSDLAFDHHSILSCAHSRIAGKLEYTPIAFSLVPPTFTVSELRAVHEAIKGQNYDPSNFRRRFKRQLEDGIIELSTGKRRTGARPAKVYRFSPPQK